MKRSHMIGIIILVSVILEMPASCHASGQDQTDPKRSGDSLEAILGRLNKAETDSARFSINGEFSETLRLILNQPGTGLDPLESLKSLVKASPDDGSFRIYHWSLTATDGKKKYYGFIKMLHRGNPQVFALRDYSDSIVSADSAVLDAGRWPGALYYRVITGTSPEGKKYYTLLGWAGRNAALTEKVIEVLSFDDQGAPVFGLPVFPGYKGGHLTRVIFRYSSSTTMSLKYQKVSLVAERKWNAARREFDIRRENRLMIVFDRLAPLDPLMEGQFEHYVTDGERCDGFAQENGVWKFVPEVIPANNP